MTSRMMSSRSYKDALELLNSTQTGSKVLKERRRLGKKLDSNALDQMREWLRQVGYTPEDLNRMNIIHVAGTNGKGTTCAFTNSILQRFQDTVQLPRKIGLYTSPHLIGVRERIRINSEPISEELFVKYFFEVWDALESSVAAKDRPAPKPPYFRYLTLMSFHVFMKEGVDAAIYEVGVGGELDSTNIIDKPVATGITALGIDHIQTLGETIDLIAWHKAGIMKSGCPTFTTEQVDEAMRVLEARAKEKEAELITVSWRTRALNKVALLPAEDFQRKNASIAVQLASCIMGALGHPLSMSDDQLPSQIVDGLKNLAWRGRREVKTTGRQHWNLPRALIFNQQSTRDTRSLLKVIYRTLREGFQTDVQYAIFCTNRTYNNEPWKFDLANYNVDLEELKGMALQREMEDAWRQFDPNSQVIVAPTIEDAIDFVRKPGVGKLEMNILVTGSFHLVGGVLAFLEKENSSLNSVYVCPHLPSEEWQETEGMDTRRDSDNP